MRAPIRFAALTVSLATLLVAGRSHAQTDAPAPDPTPKVEEKPQGGTPPGADGDVKTDHPQLRAFCTDRPTQSTQACTVDTGRLQLETDLVSATYDRGGGMITDTLVYTDPTLKLGLTHDTDVEVEMAPYESVRTRDPASGVTSTLSGVGDLTLRLKRNLFGDDGGGKALSISPFLKIPTARAGIGNGAFEGGVRVPAVFALTKSLTLIVNAEGDVRKDHHGGGVHPAAVEIVNLSVSLPADVQLAGELYAEEDHDPMGVVTRCTADLAASVQLKNDLQLDVGVNLGLNAQTAAAQGYLGLSRRF